MADPGFHKAGDPDWSAGNPDSSANESASNPASSADDPILPAGDFSSWLAGMRKAIEEQGESRVPCGGCTACCRSSQFVHIGPDETETLARIPPALLTPAPRLPAGHKVLGYDERGHCPMLVDDRCSIYDYRPRTCRTYDCRVFAATGVEMEAGQEPIARRVRQWRFAFPHPDDRTEFEAVRAAAVFVDRQRPVPTGPAAVPAAITPTVLATMAVTASRAFLSRDERTGVAHLAEPDFEQVRLQSAAGDAGDCAAGSSGSAAASTASTGSTGSAGTAG